jgi:transposase
MTPDLLRMGHWLKALGVTHVAMESTGSFWKPIFNVLEGQMEVLLVNAQHVKAVPGRKTDLKDAEWLADLLQHGLLRPSFVPPPWQRTVRELTRYRTSVVEERSRTINRMQKILEDANIKLASVATDLMGRSAREMLAALLAGEGDPAVVAELARGKMRSKRDLLKQALQGRFQSHHRFLISEQLAHIEALDEEIAHLSAEIAERLRPFEQQLKRLETIPGIKRRLGSRDPGRDWAGYESLPRRQTFSRVGGNVPWERDQCRQASERSHPQGKSLAALGPGRGSACRYSR